MYPVIRLKSSVDETETIRTFLDVSDATDTRGIYVQDVFETNYKYMIN